MNSLMTVRFPTSTVRLLCWQVQVYAFFVEKIVTQKIIGKVQIKVYHTQNWNQIKPIIKNAATKSAIVQSNTPHIVRGI